MDFWFTDEQSEWRAAVRALVTRSSPISAARAALVSGDPFDRDTWRLGTEQGWLAPIGPAAIGGLGDGIVEAAIVAEELGRVAYAGPFLSTSMAIRAISACDGSGAHLPLLAELVSGACTATWCVQDRLGLLDPTSSGTTATPVGGRIRIDGTKEMVVDGETADHLVVLASLDGAPTHLVVPRSARGVTVEPLATVDLTRRFSSVAFDGVEVEPSSVVGPPGSGADVFWELVAFAVTLLCADALGGAATLLDATVEYALEREAFGRPIGSYQAIKHKCANELLWLECSTVATYASAVTLRDDPGDSARRASMAKSFVGDALSRLAVESLQVFGGIGFTWEHDLHLYLRRLKTTELLLGSTAWHRERVASFSLAGAPTTATSP